MGWGDAEAIAAEKDTLTRTHIPPSVMHRSMRVHPFKSLLRETDHIMHQSGGGPANTTLETDFLPLSSMFVQVADMTAGLFPGALSRFYGQVTQLRGCLHFVHFLSFHLSHP